ncbi:GlyGly-CTERM sorting domain-containing protein [Geomonas terrae]|uniref:GlyGly-CTERM sorting domain-containing protein n=1 Tax=Geomonas terrae TaxID=2562681 RepID=A0A4S1CC32_9BACT|nr:GlyGly-CTERM sorting domain-containing protein [Geomonas terrae]
MTIIVTFFALSWLGMAAVSLCPLRRRKD